MMAESIDLIDIDILKSGESAYDFRQGVNQVILQANNAFTSIEGMYADFNEKLNVLDSALVELDETVDSAKEEIDQYYNDLLGNHTEDIPTVQVRRSQPVAVNGYLPKFWYKIAANGALISFAKIVKNNSITTQAWADSNGNTGNNIDWKNELETGKKISGPLGGFYIKATGTSPSGKFGISLEFEDGSYIPVNNTTNSPIGAVSSCTINEKPVIFPVKYDKLNKMLYWDLTEVSSIYTNAGINTMVLSADNILLIQEATPAENTLKQTFSIKISLNT